ncbi:MAG: cell envelope integrity protein TolA [Gammaproteobacteria bacterium]|nr:cell envelope integrity protein TolA [Gammaproteobacteria bacterium]
MLPKNLRQNPGRVRAIIYAVLVHAVVIGIAVIGFRWTVDSPSTDQVVQATAVPEPPPRKTEKVDKRAQEEEAARQKAEAEKLREAELKKKQEEELAKQRQVAERKKKEAEEKEKEKQKRAAEEERRKEDKRRQQAAEQTLQEQLAAEEKARQRAAFAARSATEIDKYRLLIRQRVSRSWNRPVGVAKGLKCVVRVRLTPTGEVVAVNVVPSSGNALFDSSVVNAVYKAAPLPLPEDPALFEYFREIEFLFNPEE